MFIGAEESTNVTYVYLCKKLFIGPFFNEIPCTVLSNKIIINVIPFINCY